VFGVLQVRLPLKLQSSEFSTAFSNNSATSLTHCYSCLRSCQLVCSFQRLGNREGLREQDVVDRRLKRLEAGRWRYPHAIVEACPDDKYLPGYLLPAQPVRGAPFHTRFAAGLKGDPIRVVTAYHPSADDWEPDLRTRRAKR